MIRIAIIAVLVFSWVTLAMALSVQQVEHALHLWPGGKTAINVGGQIIEVTYIGIEPMKGNHRYAIIVEAR